MHIKATHACGYTVFFVPMQSTHGIGWMIPFDSNTMVPMYSIKFIGTLFIQPVR